MAAALAIFGRAGIAACMHDAIAPLVGEGAPRQAIVFSIFSVAGSQLVSNVPFVILAGMWIPRLGDLARDLARRDARRKVTVIGSVAKFIVLEFAGSAAGSASGRSCGPARPPSPRRLDVHPREITSVSATTCRRPPGPHGRPLARNTASAATYDPAWLPPWRSRI